MRRIAIIVVAVLVCAHFAYAQTPTVCIYSSEDGTLCDFSNDPVGLQQYYVYLIDAPGATAVEFSAPIAPCMTGLSWIADTAVWGVTVGSSPTGVSVGFGSCQSGPVHVLTMNYFSNGITTPDCAFVIAGAEGAPSPRITDCNNNFADVDGGTAFLNSSLGCSCALQDPVPVLEVTPTTLTFVAGDSQETFSIRNIGPGVLDWSATTTVNWMTLSPAAGTGDADVTVTIDRSQILGPTIKTINVNSNGGFATIQVIIEFGSNPPFLTVIPDILRFGAITEQLSLDIRNTGGGDLNWQLLPSDVWFSASPMSGVNDQQVIVTVDRTGLPDNFYFGNLRVTSNAGLIDVPIRMSVWSTPRLILRPSSLDFGANQTVDVMTITNAGIGLLEWQASADVPWISFSQTSGSTPAEFEQDVNVIVDRTGLTGGSYTGTISVTSNGGDNDIAVTMVVAIPALTVTPLALDFPVGVTANSVEVRNTGSGVLTWAAAASQPWISVSPASGALVASAGQGVQVTVDRTQAPEGISNETVLFTSNGGTETVALTIDVVIEPVLRVTPNQLVYPNGLNSNNALVENIGNAVMNWSATAPEPWVTIVPASGTVDGGTLTNVEISVDRSTLPHGTSTATVDFTSDGGNASIDLTVENITEPILDVVPTGIAFNQVQSSKAFVIRNIGVGTLEWSLSWAESWISVDQASGTGDATIIVTIDVPNAPASATDAVISVTSNGGDQDVGIFWRPVVAGIGGSIGVYADPVGVQPCVEDVIGLVTLRVVHTNTVGATASQFSAPLPICWTGAVWLSDTQNGVVIGNSQTGVAIGYGACLPTPIHILSINVFAQGLTQVDCCAYSVLPDPNVPSGQIEVVNCANELIFGNGFTSFVSTPPCNCAPSVKTEVTTWGAIKSIYSETPAQAASRKGK